MTKFCVCRFFFFHFIISIFLLCITASASAGLLGRSMSPLFKQLASELPERQIINTLAKIRMMHGSRIDVSSYFTSLALHAVRHDKGEVVNHLIEEKGVNVRAVLRQALYHGHREIITFDMIKRMFKKVDDYGFLLTYFAGYDDLEMLKRLVKLVEELGMEIDDVRFSNKVDGMLPRIGGRTALQEAVNKNLVENVRYLLKKGADANRAGKHPNGLTPLHYATLFGNLEMAELLLKNGAQ